jgi:hypothetical protein
VTKGAQEIVIAYDGNELVVSVNGVRIARRGRPNTPQAGTWVSQPGWRVLDEPDGNISVEFDSGSDN